MKGEAVCAVSESGALHATWRGSPARCREAHTGLGSRLHYDKQISDQQINQGRGEEFRVVEAFNQEKALVVRRGFLHDCEIFDQVPSVNLHYKL